MVKIGSVCSGYGGLDLAVERVFGGTLAWVADPDPAASRVLEKRFPVPNLGDIRQVDWQKVEPVDILAGGTPCQDISNAGARKGLAGEKSSLWFNFMEAVDAIKPKVVIWENVPGARTVATGHTGDGRVESRVLGTVLAGLASRGYNAEWCSVQASDIGAAHRRERVFLLAWKTSADSGSILGGARGNASGTQERARCDFGGCCSIRLKMLPGYDEALKRHACAYPAAPIPSPVEQGRRGNVLSPLFVEWLMMLPPGWVTGVPGLSKTAKLRLLGNGVVPKQAECAVRLLVDRAKEAV